MIFDFWRVGNSLGNLRDPRGESGGERKSSAESEKAAKSTSSAAKSGRINENHNGGCFRFLVFWPRVKNQLRMQAAESATAAESESESN